MAYKKLSEAVFVEDAMDTATVLIEENDEIKRVPKSVMGKVKTVNGIEPDEAGDVVVGTVKSVNNVEPGEDGNIELEITNTWTDLEEKPFEDLGLIEWDGDTNNRDSVDVYGYMYYKVSDLTPSIEQIINSFMELTVSDGYQSQSMPLKITSDMIYQKEGGYICVYDYFGFIVANSTVLKESSSANNKLSRTTFASAPEEINVPSPGIYFMKMQLGAAEKFKIGERQIFASDASSTTMRVSALQVVEKIDVKFIPSTVLFTDGTYMYWDSDLYNIVTRTDFIKSGIDNGIIYLMPELGTKMMIFVIFDRGDYIRLIGPDIIAYTAEYVPAAS